MAIAFVSNPINAVATPAGASTASFAWSSGYTVGNLLVLMVAFDNSQGGGFGPCITNVYNSGPEAGQQWKRMLRSVNAGVGVDTGAVCEMWVTFAGATRTPTNLVIDFSGGVQRVVAQVRQFSGVARGRFTSVAVPPFPGTTGNGTTIAVGSASVSTGQLVLGCAAIETNAAITGDADVTNGAWTAILTGLNNSGADLTSMTLSSQYKIPTGSGTQDLAFTVGAAKDYAATFIVFQEATSSPVADLSRFNPYDNFPGVAGNELLPNGAISLPVDVGTRYRAGGFVRSNWASCTDWRAYAEIDPLDYATLTQHTLVTEWFRPVNDVTGDVVERSIIPLTTTAGRVIRNGGADVAATLATTNGVAVTLDGSINDYVDLAFEPTAGGFSTIFAGRRIVRIGILYRAWKDDAAPAASGEGFELSWRDLYGGIDGVTLGTSTTGAALSRVLSAFLVPKYQRDAPLELKWLGEINPLARVTLPAGGIVSGFGVSHLNRPWAVNDLQLQQGGALAEAKFRITAGAGTDPLNRYIYLDSIQLVVEHVPERRQAVASQTISNHPTAPAAFNPTTLGMWAQRVDPSQAFEQTSLTQGQVVVTIREALPADPADYYRAKTSGAPLVGWNEAFGPSIKIRGITQPRHTLGTSTGADGITRVPFNGGGWLTQDTLSNGVPYAFGDYMSERIAFDCLNYEWLRAAYIDDSPLILSPGVAANDSNFGLLAGAGFLYDVSGGPSPLTTALPITSSTPRPSSTDLFRTYVPYNYTYDRVRVVCRPDPTITTQTLVIDFVGTGRTATIGLADLTNNGREIGNGWYEVSVPIAATPLTPGAASTVTYRITSNASTSAPWYVAFAFSRAPYNFYGHWANDEQPEVFLSVPVLLQPEMTAPDIDVTLDYFLEGELNRNAYACGIEVTGGVTNVPYATITVNNSEDFDAIVIQRRTNVVSQLTLCNDIRERGNPGFTYYDNAVPTNTASIEYRAIGYRDADRREAIGSWVALPSTPIASPGSTIALWDGQSGYGFGYFFYGPSSDGTLELEWETLASQETAQLHGQDFQVPVRAPEFRGYRLSFTAIIDNLMSCTTAQTETPADAYGYELAVGGQAISSAPFLDLNSQALRTRPLWVRFPSGEVRSMSLSLGALTNVPEYGVFSAEIILTDAPSPSDTPLGY